MRDDARFDARKRPTAVAAVSDRTSGPAPCGPRAPTRGDVVRLHLEHFVEARAEVEQLIAREEVTA